MTKVPSQYQQAVTHAAQVLGIPEAVVAAQIDVESGFDPTAVSPVGAEGIAQFMPGTWKSYSSGNPFDPVAAFDAYTRYMSDLLHQEGGDVRKALEAYNAGPNNLSAGAGYATKILAQAGTGDTTTSGGTTPAGGDSSSGGLLSFPTDIVKFFTKGVDQLTTVGDWFAAFTKPSTYVRMGSGALGTVFLIVGIICLAKETRNS